MSPYEAEVEPSGKDLVALQTTASRNECCLATPEKQPSFDFLQNTACRDNPEIPELQGPVTGTCPCSNPDYPCYAYYSAGILGCVDCGATSRFARRCTFPCTSAIYSLRCFAFRR